MFSLDELRGAAKKWRKDHGLTQLEMFKLAGGEGEYSSQYSDWERGKTGLNYNITRRIEELIAPALPADLEPILPAQPPAPPAPSEQHTLKCDWICPGCHQQVPGFSQGAMVCCYCGETLGPECPKCGTVNLPDSRFCRGCGNPLTDSAVLEKAKDKEDLGRLTETPKQKKLRLLDEREARQKAARKRGEPQF